MGAGAAAKAFNLGFIVISFFESSEDMTRQIGAV
jgi:hypothetical protein